METTKRSPIEPLASVLLDGDSTILTVSARLRYGHQNWTPAEAGRWFAQLWDEAYQTLTASVVLQALQQTPLPQLVLRGAEQRVVVPPPAIKTLPVAENGPAETITPAEPAPSLPPAVREPSGAEEPPRRRPGRPRKPVDPQAAMQTKRKPGRPRKHLEAILPAATVPAVEGRTPRISDDPAEEAAVLARDPFEDEIDEPQPADLHHGHKNGEGNGRPPAGPSRGRPVVPEDDQRDEKRILSMVGQSNRPCTLTEIRGTTGIAEPRLRRAIQQLVDRAQLEERSIVVSGRQVPVPAYSLP